MLRLKAPIARVGRRRRLLASNRPIVLSTTTTTTTTTALSFENSCCHRYKLCSQHLQASSRAFFSSLSNAPKQQEQEQQDSDDHEILSSAKELHEHRVAQAQTAARNRRQQYETFQQQAQLLRKTQKVESEKRHAISNGIQHWLTKDTSFFQSTMTALNLNSQWTNNQDDESVKAVLNQYRHLYYDSIPSFRIEVEKNPPPSLSHAISQLDMMGFSDQKWSKHYRQVKGLLFQQENFARRVSKQKGETKRRNHILKTAERDLEELQEMEQLTNRVWEQKNKKARAVSTKKSLSSMPKQQQEPPLLHQFFSLVSSMVFSSPQPQQQQQQPNNHQDDEMMIPTKPRESRLQKRIKRKQIGISNFRHDAKAATEKLKQIQDEYQRFSLPIPQEQYHKANQVVVEVRDDICQELALHIQQRHAQLIEQYQKLDAKTDLTKPHEWYPYARLDRRKIIFHGGPTNSGKTYNALKRLMKAEKGLYLGPLRLLAAEVYETLTSDGIYTNLFTGQERREIAFSTHASATVEMANTNEEYDVVVIDEIQMIKDTTRGAAWTKALLGLRCKEIHVCGGLEAKSIVQKIAKACGDDFELHRYKRFAPLTVADRSLSSDPNEVGCYKKVQPGDCVVAFSRNDIFAIKREIEKTTGHKCCVIYGKLPPQTRTDQARRFNDPNSGYDILVASDAIGMGLNLNIRRIIFNSVFKFNGEEVVRLDHSAIKQISGRAGRRNSPYPNGEVTCRDPRDLDYIRDCLSTEIETIEKAGLLPTAAHIELFNDALEEYDIGKQKQEKNDLYRILCQFSAMATVKGDFFLCRQTEMRTIAKKLNHIPLPIRDAYTMCLSPTSEHSLPLVENFAKKFSLGQVPGLPHHKVPKKAKSFDDLSHLCTLYGDADLFMWMQYKFPPSNAIEHQAALARKEQTLDFINQALAKSENLKLNHCYVKQATRHRALWSSEQGTIDKNGPVFDDDYGEYVEEEDYFTDEDEEKRMC